MSDDHYDHLMAGLALVQDSAEQTKLVIKQAGELIAEGKLRERRTSAAVKEGIDSLVSLANQEIRRIDSRVDEVLAPQIERTRWEIADLKKRHKAACWRYAVFVIIATVVVCAGLFGFTWFNYTSEKGEYKTYWESERASGFGFKVVTTDTKDYVVFDKEFELGECKVNGVIRTYCATIKPKQ